MYGGIDVEMVCDVWLIIEVFGVRSEECFCMGGLLWNGMWCVVNC